MNSPIIDFAKATALIETLENYSVSDKGSLIDQETKKDYPLEIYSEGRFWNQVINDTENYWNHEFQVDGIFSEWIPRIPGLYWNEGSEANRFLADRFRLENPIEYGGGKDYHLYQPVGKSAHVSGGIGTIKLPPDDRGILLCTISLSANISTGIPVLIFPNVIEDLKLKEGDGIIIKKAKWRKMSIEWQSKFSSIKGIPRGYLVIEESSQIKKYNGENNTLIQPFSIMEYPLENSLLYDFVYVSANALDNNFRTDAEAFFEKYRRQYSNSAKYLLSIDSSNPIFDAVYNLPRELEEKDSFGRTQLDLMKERIRNVYFNNWTIDELVSIIPKYYKDPDNIIRIARQIDLNESLIEEDMTAKMSINLVALALKESKMELLIDLIISENPKIIK